MFSNGAKTYGLKFIAAPCFTCAALAAAHFTNANSATPNMSSSLAHPGERTSARIGRPQGDSALRPIHKSPNSDAEIQSRFDWSTRHESTAKRSRAVSRLETDAGAMPAVLRLVSF